MAAKTDTVFFSVKGQIVIPRGFRKEFEIQEVGHQKRRGVPPAKLVPMLPGEPERLPKNGRQLGGAQNLESTSGLLRQRGIMPISKMPTQIIQRE